jgi:uncharacterized membrane protein
LRYNRKLRQLSIGAISLCIITFVLVTTFFFETGFIGHITNGYPYSFSLDLQRRESSSDISIRAGTHTSYFLDGEVLSAMWLQRNLEPTTMVYADSSPGDLVLKSYAHLPYDRTLLIKPGLTPSSGTFVYLIYINVRIGRVYVAEGKAINTTELQPGLERCGKVYSNGDNEIYYSP